MGIRIDRRGSCGPAFPIQRSETALGSDVVQDLAIAATALRSEDRGYVRSIVSVEAALREDSYRDPVCTSTRKTGLSRVSRAHLIVQGFKEALMPERLQYIWRDLVD